jgi:hypothetical protein
MPLSRSTRCCNKGIAFGTVSLLPSSAEIHVKLHGEPCCAKEFASFIAVLSTTRGHIPDNKPFYILYNLTHATFNRSYMAAQEKVLQGAIACAIVLPRKSLLRGAIKMATVVQKKTKIKICDTVPDGVRWLNERRLDGK